ncbi:MAG: hypothetical protein WB868_16335, partial [Xanthobacteraceae bacterium]
AAAFIMFGLGGVAFDPAGGETVFTKRIAAIGVNTLDSPYQETNVDTIVSAILATPTDTKIIVGGDSLGANNTPAVAQALLGRRNVDYIFGFQPSEYGAHNLVPANVLQARCIYNPNPIETAGLGCYEWQLAAGNRTTKLSVVTNSDFHPGDDDVAMQNLILADIERLVG